MKTSKLLLAESKYCRQIDSILHVLPELLSGVPNRLRWLCAVWSEVPQFEQVVIIIKYRKVVSIGEAALALCSLVGLSPVCAGGSYCQEC